MIIKKRVWEDGDFDVYGRKRFKYTGYFIFGFIPIYIKRERIIYRVGESEDI